MAAVVVVVVVVFQLLAAGISATVGRRVALNPLLRAVPG